MKGLTRYISLILAVVLLVSSLAICVYAEDEIKSGIGFVTASALRLRSGPSTDYATLDYAYNGDAVVVLEKDCTAQRIYDEIRRLLSDDALRDRMTAGLHSLVKQDSTQRICDMVEELANS